MKLVVMALTASLPSMINVILVASLFVLVFSIMGVNYFKGALYRCEHPYEQKINLNDVFTKNDCIEKGGRWVNSDANFDDTL